MEAKYKLVIFDCDGTLVDTAVDVAHCFNEALAACGFPSCSFDTISSLIGKPLEEIVGGLIRSKGMVPTEEDIMSVSDAYRSIYAESPKPNTKPFPGIVELLSALTDADVAIGVNSNKPEPALIDLIQKLFPQHDIRIAGYTTDRPVKPDPTGALEMVRREGLEPNDAVYVGDTAVDVETANNAEIDCVFVTWGQGTHDLFNRGGSTVCCDTIDELRIALGVYHAPPIAHNNRNR